MNKRNELSTGSNQLAQNSTQEVPIPDETDKPTYEYPCDDPANGATYIGNHEQDTDEMEALGLNKYFSYSVADLLDRLKTYDCERHIVVYHERRPNGNFLDPLGNEQPRNVYYKVGLIRALAAKQALNFVFYKVIKNGEFDIIFKAEFNDGTQMYYDLSTDGAE